MGNKQIDKGSAAFKKYRRRKILFITEVVVLLLLMVVAFFYIQLQKRLDTIQIEVMDTSKIEMNDAPQTDEVIKGYTNLALFAADSRAGIVERTNTDTIIIASINNDTKEVKLVSVYRDTYLNVGDTLYRKANAAYANGGPEWGISMLNRNLDLDITDFVTVDFNSMSEVVDLLGGIEITVDDAECVHLNNYCVETSQVTGKSYENLPGAGTYTMNGVQAVSYTRIRYTAGSDFKRTERQREVIAKIIAKVKGASMTTLVNIMDEVFPMIRTSLTKSEILSMGINMLSYKLGETTGFPFTHKTGGKGGSGDDEVPITLESNAIELHRFLFEKEDYSPSKELLEINAKIIEDTGYDENTNASSENFILHGDEVDRKDETKKQEINGQNGKDE